MTRWRVEEEAASEAAVECVPGGFTEAGSVVVACMPDVSTAEDVSRAVFARATRLQVARLLVVQSRGVRVTLVAQSPVTQDGPIHGAA
jgi:hypothetical protein